MCHIDLCTNIIDRQICRNSIALHYLCMNVYSFFIHIQLYIIDSMYSKKYEHV